MKQSNWKDIAELVGIAAIVASLVFVGLQMRQSQEIAIAAQYHNRAALAIEANNTQIESGDLRAWGLLSGKARDGDLATHFAELTTEQWGRVFLFGMNTSLQMDNHYFQYQSGFMDEEVWQGHRAMLKVLLSNPNFPVSIALSTNRVSYRASFLELCDQLISEVKAEAAD